MLSKLDFLHTYAIVDNKTKMDEYLFQVEIDLCSRSFNLTSDDGNSKEIYCDTTDEFMRILRVCDELLEPKQIVYKDLVLDKDK